MTLFELWFSQGICPVVGLLGRMVVLFIAHIFTKFFCTLKVSKTLTSRINCVNQSKITFYLEVSQEIVTILENHVTIEA